MSGWTGKCIIVPQLSWLEHYTDNVGVSSSSLLGTTFRQGNEPIGSENPVMIGKWSKGKSSNMNWGISSVGQSACFARRRSRVRLPYSPQESLSVNSAEFFEILNVFLNTMVVFSGSIPDVFTIPQPQPVSMHSKLDRGAGKRSLTYWKELNF